MPRCKNLGRKAQMKTNLKLFKLYVGHNNTTQKRFSEDLICNLCDRFFQGYTILKTNGFYLGNKEESYLIEIVSHEENQVNKLKSLLQQRLKQDSILKTSYPLDTAEF